MEKFEKDLYSQLCYELNSKLVMFTFIKKDGTIRNLLGTKSKSQIQVMSEDAFRKLSGYEKRASIDNGNLAVVDMVIAEPRMVNVERLLRCVVIDSMYIDTYNDAYEPMKLFEKFCEESREVYGEKLEMDTFDKKVKEILRV